MTEHLTNIDSAAQGNRQQELRLLWLIFLHRLQAITAALRMQAPSSGLLC
jgi:hypothetical protein